MCHFYITRLKSRDRNMNTRNQLSSAASKITVIRRIKNRKDILNELRSEAVASILHQTKNSLQPMLHQHSTQIQKYMNTYRLESKNSFKCALVYTVLEDVVNKQCFGVKYDPVKCASIVQTAAQEIMNQLKKFEFDRYRLIVFVEIGSNKYQEVETAVKFLWDASKDKFATYTLKSGSMFTSATCFGVYQD